MPEDTALCLLHVSTIVHSLYCYWINGTSPLPELSQMEGKWFFMRFFIRKATVHVKRGVNIVSPKDSAMSWIATI